MYHYVRKDDKNYPNFRFLHVDDFQRQLDYFQSEYGFVNKADFIQSFQGGPKPEGIILTFDDGVWDHYHFAYKILAERKLWGIFYVPTFIFGTIILDVHRIHLLLGKFASLDLYQALNDIVTDDMLIDKNRADFSKNPYENQKNDEYTIAFKRTLNYSIGYEYRKPVIDQLMNLFFGVDHDFGNFYLKPAEIQEMHHNNMMIGSHSVNHYLMSKLSEKEQKDEIVNSFVELEKLTGALNPRTFCYPYGVPGSFTPVSEKVLSDADVLFSFCVKSRDITTEDIRNRPQALPRFDCNEFKFGQCRM